MKEVLKDIQSGKFTKQWMEEHKSGQKNFLNMRKQLADHPIEKVGKQLRAMMPWIGKNKLVDKDKKLAQSDQKNKVIFAKVLHILVLLVIYLKANER